jgi:hypothetical protein
MAVVTVFGLLVVFGVVQRFGLLVRRRSDRLHEPGDDVVDVSRDGDARGDRGAERRRSRSWVTIAAGSRTACSRRAVSSAPIRAA